MRAHTMSHNNAEFPERSVDIHYMVLLSTSDRLAAYTRQVGCISIMTIRRTYLHTYVEKKNKIRIYLKSLIISGVALRTVREVFRIKFLIVKLHIVSRSKSMRFRVRPVSYNFLHIIIFTMYLRVYCRNLL